MLFQVFLSSIHDIARLETEGSESGFPGSWNLRSPINHRSPKEPEAPNLFLSDCIVFCYIRLHYYGVISSSIVLWYRSIPNHCTQTPRLKPWALYSPRLHPEALSNMRFRIYWALEYHTLILFS